MKFTPQEILFLNSVTKGGQPFNMNSRLPKGLKGEEIVEGAIQGLMEKGLLDEERHLTKDGTAMLVCWQEYRNSKVHLLVNRLNVAVLPGNMVVTVYEKEGGYEIECMSSEVLMLAILKQCEYLRQGEEKPERGTWKTVSIEQWVADAGEAEDGVPIFVYHGNKMREQSIYYWKEQQGYLFDLKKSRLRTLSAGVMRRQIYRKFTWEEYENA